MTPNSLYTNPLNTKIIPQMKRDGIVIRWISQYRLSCRMSMNGLSPVLTSSELSDYGIYL